MNPVSDFPWKYKHVAADTLVASGHGCLHSIVINGLTTVGDATIYDNTAELGTIIGVLHLNTATSVSVQPITLLYDIEFNTGLYIGFDATLVADLTVSYK